MRRVVGRSGDTASPTLSHADQLQVAVDAAHRHARGVVIVAGPAELDVQSRNLRALDAVAQRRGRQQLVQVRESRFRRAVAGSVPSSRRLELRRRGDLAVAEAIKPALLDLMGYR